MKLSGKFIIAARLASGNNYRIAMRADVHPSQLSRWLNGAELIRNNDPRPIRIGQLLGLSPDECLEADAEREVPA